jgi:flagellar protein FlgJ
VINSDSPLLNNGASLAASSAQVYTDLNSVQNLKALAKRDKNAALQQVAQQFEAVMMQMMMKSMRQANSVFGEGDPLNSNESQMYRDMFDSQLTVSLAQGRGMGIAAALLRQLQQTGAAAPADAIAQAGAAPVADAPAHGLLDYARSTLRAAEITRALDQNAALPASDNAGVDDTYEQLLALMSAPDESAQPFDMSALAADRLDGTPAEFVDALMPVAEQVAAQLGVDSRVLLSQAALETGWGEKVIRRADGSSSFNFFNIKATPSWKGDIVTVPTTEYRNGVAVREFAAFRAYASPAESFADYAQLIGNSPRYQQALAQADDPRAYMHALQRAGYATDPRYAQKVLDVFASASVQAAPLGADDAVQTR